MIKTFLTNCALFLWLLSMLTLSHLSAQQTVFTETFNTPGTPQNSAFTTSGPIGTSLWTVTRSGNDFGAKIDQGFLTLTNDVGSTGNAKGWVLASTSTSNFLPAYNPILGQNPGIVSWSFNMRQLRTNPAGLTAGNFGVAYVLAGTAGSTGTSGKGYAIMLGQPGTKDAIRLVTYNNGIQTYYTKLSSNTSGLSDFGREYTSIRVEYNPVNNEWSMYVRKDGSNSFIDPKSGTLISQGKTTSSEFVGESLTMTGAYWNAATTGKQTAFFDNVSVSVVVPEIISINPDSKIANSGAFNIIVEGNGFTNATKLYWDGVVKPTTVLSPTQLSAGIAATDIQLPRILPITVRNGSFISNAVDFEIESSGVPTLTLSKTILPFISTVQGTPSVATDTYTISGINLTTSAVLTAPLNFELSVNNGAYADTQTLANSGGVLLNQPLNIKARLKSTAQAGNYTGNITHTTTGALTTKVVGVTGRVLAIKPTANATLPTFTNITSTGFRLGWTNSGNGDQRIVLIRALNAVNGLPVDATTYNPNAAFATGSLIGADNYVVYKGNGNSVQITGLDPNKLYHISIIEFNGLAGTESYRTPGLVGSATTLNSPAGLQVKLVDTSYKIDFDNTVDGVNLDTFQGAGIAKIAEQGQLDSDSWAFTGFSSGAINFGGESLEDSSYENGTSDGDEIDTGIYAFNVGTAADENYTLGIQPGGTDFNPGTISLKIQNQNATAITSLNIGYKVYVYNDQAASSKIAFNYSSDQGGINGFSTSDASLDVISPASADLAPGWKAYYRVTTITGLNIAKDKFFYIKWSGSLISGTGAQDEFAIDDIEVIANPTTTFASFDGIAEDFVLQGNASLSADLSVQNRLIFNGGKLAIKDKTLTIAGNVSNTTPGGLKGGPNSKLVVRGVQNPTLSFDQTTLGTSNLLNSFSLFGANPNTVTIANNLSVNNILKIDEQQILDLGTNTLGGTLLGGTLGAVENNGIIRTQNTSLAPFPANKTWVGTGVLNLNSNDPIGQTLVGGIYTNLTLSSNIDINRGTKASSDVTVNGILHLPNANASATMGSLSMSTFTLVMGPDGTNTGIGDVTGIIRRNSFVTNKLYTFGHPNSSITFPGGGTKLPSTISAKLTIGTALTWRPTPVKRYFDIIQTGAIETKATIRQHYLESELNTNAGTKLVFWGRKLLETPFEQGRSNYNATENWVEISNADVGLYFKPTFDQVHITLDESEAAHLTWNGSLSTSWITSENWTPNGVPNATTKVNVPNKATTFNRSPVVGGEFKVKSLSIEPGGIVDTPTESILTIFDGAGAWINNGIFNHGNGTVIFNSLDATIAGSTTFYNLTIPAERVVGTVTLPAAGLRALEGNYMSIAGTLTNGGTMFTTLFPNTIEFLGTGQTIPNVNGLDFGGYHHLIVTGTGATLAPSISTLNLRGNLTLNQPLSFIGKKVNLAGILDQTIAGNAAINFDNLIVNKLTGAVLLAQDISVGGTLSLTEGNLVIGANNLALGPNAVFGNLTATKPFSVANMIVADGSGVVRRPFAGIGSYEFPIGELSGAPSYAPITVNLTAASSFSNAFVSVNVVDAKHPNNNSLQNHLTKYWNVSQTGITNAVATITSTYEPLDIIGAPTDITAAQLNGDLISPEYPWIKFDKLSANTLVAINAALPNNKNSAFTGLKAGDFSVEVYGYGDFCIGSTHKMNAVISGGDAPYNYIWSNGLPNASEVLIPTAVAATTNYTLTVIDANGFSATDTNIPVEIFPASIGGTVSSANQQICAGTIPADLQLTGSVGEVLYWQKSTDMYFTANNESNPNNVTNISNITTTLTGAEIGTIETTTYIRAVLQNGDCAEKFSTIATVIIKTTTWNGTEWTDGAPDQLTSAIFAGDYNTSAGEITACNCEVKPWVVLTVNTGHSAIFENDIINNGKIIIESDGNLIQVSNEGKYVTDSSVIPVSSFVVKRKANIKRLDYVYWSSPVTGRKLKDFSPGTLNNRFLTYNEWNDEFTAVPDVTATFKPTKGYAIRASNTQSAAVTDWTGQFIGTPNNGLHQFTLEKSINGNGYNLVGNPYPSNISFDSLVDQVKNPENAALIYNLAYFWTNTNPNGPMQGSGYPKDGLINNYAIYNGIGGLSATAPATNTTPENPIFTVSSPTPDGTIKVGQGFIVKAINAGDLIFRNNIKQSASGNFFDKYAQKDRFWLHLTTPLHVQTAALIGYKASATNGFELDYDAPLMVLGADAFYSVLDDRRLAIQGRSSFVNTDKIPLGSSHYEKGNYIISLGNREGVFANGQNIYLKDKQTGVVTNLSEGSYTFIANKGVSEGRFDIVYQPEIVLSIGGNQKEELVIYRDGNDFVVKAQTKKINDVEVYDTSGRLIYDIKPNSTLAVIASERLVDGVYVVKINQNGKITTRKIIK